MAFAGSEPAGDSEGRARVDGRIHHSYDEEIAVDIFSGPSFRFERCWLPNPASGEKEPAVRVLFLPWHRRWSHSLTLAAALGAAGWLLLGWQAGAVVAAGMAAHVLEDQLGHMGSNLLWPLTRRRTPGLRLLRSGDALPNVMAVWVALVLTLWNLNRFAPQPAWDGGRFLLLALGLPMLVIAGIAAWRRRARPAMAGPAERQAEILAETEEIQF